MLNYIPAKIQIRKTNLSNMVYMNQKLDQLKRLINEMGSVVVAYSGGVDSTFMLKVAYDCLGERALGITAVSASLASGDREEAETVARQIGVAHRTIESQETADERYLENTSRRCYFCKNNVYAMIGEIARQEHYNFIVDGTNADDTGDHRPGRQAAREMGVRSPLVEVGMTKAEIRELAHQMNLPNWDKPAAACLSSRIPYGTTITVEMLSQVEQAERVLKEKGLRQVRVRHHGQTARIEVEPADFQFVLDHREEIISAFKSIGFTFIALDLSGFHSGSMNEMLNNRGH